METKLVTIMKPNFIHDDQRGTLIQLVREGYRQFNVVTTHAGVFRGGHYHKINKEAFFVIAGEFRLLLDKDDIHEEYIFKSGDMFEIEPYVLHGFEYIKESTLVAMYDIGVSLADGGMDSYTLQ